MNLLDPMVAKGSLSQAARLRMRSRLGEPLFVGDWDRTLMLHLEVDTKELQRVVPFELDLFDGRAFVSLVAFTLRGMRLAYGGALGAWLMRPIASHRFLNVRAYVRHRGESGIHFLAEWLSNRLAVRLGPPTFGLPYHHGRLHYVHEWERGDVRGVVEDAHSGSALEYQVESSFSAAFAPCAGGSLDEWLMERYTAFTQWSGRARLFRVWHPPWPQIAVEATISNIGLLTERWPMFRDAMVIGANFSPGVPDVWMGRPHFLPRA